MAVCILLTVVGYKAVDGLVLVYTDFWVLRLPGMVSEDLDQSDSAGSFSKGDSSFGR